MTLANVMDAVYRQRRRNEAFGLSGDVVDIIATKQYADRFHKMLERNVRAESAMPKIIKWTESTCSVVGADVRRYTSDHIGWPLCEVSVLIPTGYRAIFAVPDYHAMTYFDLTTMKTRKFPKAKK